MRERPLFHWLAMNKVEPGLLDKSLQKSGGSMRNMTEFRVASVPEKYHKSAGDFMTELVWPANKKSYYTFSCTRNSAGFVRGHD